MANGTETNTATMPDYGNAVLEKMQELRKEGKVKAYAVNGQAKYEFSTEGFEEYTRWLHTFVLDQAQDYLITNLSK